MNSYDPKGFKGSRIQGFKWKAKKYPKKGTQILLAGDLDLIEKGELDTLQKDIAEIERMLKALIKSLENRPLDPWPLESLDPLLQQTLMPGVGTTKDENIERWLFSYKIGEEP